MGVSEGSNPKPYNNRSQLGIPSLARITPDPGIGSAVRTVHLATNLPGRLIRCELLRRICADLSCHGCVWDYCRLYSLTPWGNKKEPRGSSRAKLPLVLLRQGCKDSGRVFKGTRGLGIVSGLIESQSMSFN